MTFSKDSAFSLTAKQQEHLEEIRKRALNVEAKAISASFKPNTAAMDLFDAASICIEEKEFDRAIDLLRQARDELETPPTV